MQSISLIWCIDATNLRLTSIFWLAPATFAYWNTYAIRPLYEGATVQWRLSSRCQETKQRSKSSCQAAALLVWSSWNMSLALEWYRDSIYTCTDSLFFFVPLSLGHVLVKTSFESRAASSPVPPPHTRRRQWYERLAWPMFRSTSKIT